MRNNTLLALLVGFTANIAYASRSWTARPGGRRPGGNRRGSGIRPTVQGLEERVLMADGTYRIVEAQLQIVGGIGGHDLLVVIDPQGNVIKELDGLATGSDNQPTAIGVLPWTTRLKVWSNVELATVPDSNGKLPPPGSWSSYYSEDEPQTTIFSGTEADVMNHWDGALAGMNQINALNLYYPMIGLGQNSNSVASTEIQCMGLTEPTIPGGALLVPGSGSLLLNDQAIGTILQQHNIAPTATDTSPSVTSEEGQKNADGSFTLTTVFSDDSRDVETDSTGGAQEKMYAASGQIMTDATVDDATSSLSIDQYLDPSSNSILTQTFALDTQGDIAGGPTIGYQADGHVFNTQELATDLGSRFASLLIDSSNPAVQIATKALGAGVFSATFGAVKDLSSPLLDPTSGTFNGLDSVLGDALGNLADSTSRALLTQTESSLGTMAIAAEAQLLGLHGFAGQVFTKTGASITQQLESNLVLAQSSHDYSVLLNGFNVASIATSLGTAAGSILGQDLGGKLTDPSTVGQQLLASLGANVGSDLGAAEGLGLASTLSTTIATTLGTDALATIATDAILDLVLPGVGALIGSFLGEVAGSEIYTLLNDITFGLFGDLFGGGEPWEYQYFRLDTATNQLTDPADLTYTKHTDAKLRNAVASLSNGVCSGVNSVIALIGGQATVSPGAAPFDTMAWVNNTKSWGANDFQVEIAGNSSNHVNMAGDAAKIVRIGVDDDLRQLSFIGGDPILVHAFDDWKATPQPSGGDSLSVLDTYLQVASDYEKYLANPEAINVLMKEAPASEFTLGWIDTLSQAQALGLNAADPAHPNLETTGTTLSVPTSPGVFGDSEVLTATVNVVSPGTPSGMVTFHDGNTILGTAAVATYNGTTTASLRISTLGVGSHQITASYDGDVYYAGSSSTAQGFTVQNATTSVVAASPTSTAFGQSVTFKATVAVANPAKGTPTGAVTFMDGTTILGTGTLSTNAGVTTATFTTTTLAVGTHPITIVYAGDTNDMASTSTTLSYAVAKDSTKTSLTVAPTSSVYGQAVTFKATVIVVSPGKGTPTGTVTFKDGSTTLGTGTLTTSAGITTASFTSNTLAVGMRSITAVYDGDSNDTGSTSTTLGYAVAKDPTKTSLTVAPSSSAYGQPVTFKATVVVTSPGAGAPTGTVTFKDGSTTLGTGTLTTNAGITTASFTTTTLAVGAHSITAVYAGDVDDVTSSSAALSYAVAKDSTKTSLAATPSSSVYGQTVTFKATVVVASPGAGSPTGTVTFKDGSNTLGTGTLSTSAGVTSATFTTTLAVGTHSIIAIYAGDINDVTNTSTSINYAVAKDATNTTLTTTPTAAVYGQSVTLKATVAVASPGKGTPTGVVTFKDGTTILGTGTLSTNGGVAFATLTTELAVGTHSLTTTYAGDSNDTGSTSAALGYLVAKDSTKTSLTVAPSSSVYGQAVTFKATVAVASPGAGTPTGTVTFKDGSTILGSAILGFNGGVSLATFTTTTLAVGTHSITAVYAGDTNDVTSSSTTLSYAVAKDFTKTSLTVAPSGSAYGQAVTFKATVIVASPGVNTPMGTVTFKDGSTVLGSAALSFNNGVSLATFTTTTLAVGTRSITAVYVGDGNDLTSSSAALNYAVAKDSTKTSLAATPSSSVYGQAVIFKATVAVASPGAGSPAGTVTFKDGSNTLGTGTLSTSAGVTTATFTTTTLAVGTHAITAVYAGDTNDVTSSSTTLSYSVAKDSTGITLTATPTAPVYGQKVTFKATLAVASPGKGTSTGVITFMDGTTVLGAGTLSTSGGITTATFSTSALAMGSHSITAIYAGDTDDVASTSATLSYAVAKDSTSTTLTATPTTAVYGQAVTFKAVVAVVSPGAGTPTGTVTFKDGSTTLGLGTLSTSGGVTFATLTTELAVGTHSLTTTYAGDSDDTESTSATLSYIVAKDSTKTSLIATPSSSVYGQAITFKATVTVASPGVGAPTGTVTFKDGSTVLGSAALNFNGGVPLATFTTTMLAVGTHSITAVYAGDSNDVTSTSAALSYAVAKDSTKTSLTVAPSSSVYGQAVAFKATVAVANPGAGIPTGTVTFKDGSTTLGTGTLTTSGGITTATFTTTTLAAGTHSITAVYVGDVDDATSTSTALSYSVAKDSTNISLTATPTTATHGQAVTFKAAVAVASPGKGTPTGVVTFMDGATILGTGTLSTVNGVTIATFTTSALAVGTHSIIAIYDGDTDDLTSTSTALSLKVS